MGYKPLINEIDRGYNPTDPNLLRTSWDIQVRCIDFSRKSFHPIESPVGPSNGRVNESVFRRGLFGVFKIAILEWSGFLGQKILVIYSLLSPLPSNNHRKSSLQRIPY